MSSHIKRRPKLRPAIDHSSRFILRPAPARNPMMLPQRTMPKITLMATMLGVIGRTHFPFLLSLRSSTQLAAAMQPLLSTIHAISQKRLNGSPKTMGYTRSQRGTEKHIPRKGMQPRASAPADGRCMNSSYCDKAMLYEGP